MKTLLCFVFLLTTSIINCQNSDVSNNLWASCGPGFFRYKANGGFSLYSGIDWSRNKLIERNNGTKIRNNALGLRYIFHFVAGDENLVGQLSEFGILYGKSFGKILQLTISGGLGVIGGTKIIDFGPYYPMGPAPYRKKEYYSTLNIPVEIGISLNPIKYFGIGIKRFGSFNNKQSLNGYLLTFKFGKVR
jgi:hypothetical protein